MNGDEKTGRDSQARKDRIRLATSIPSLKDKIHVDIAPDTDDVYWYIRFNIPLDEESVSEKTMDVTDTEGYIMRTDITYDKNRNMIVISPIDSYEQDVFYLLNISQKVKSAKGQNLRSKIHILFKLLEGEISEFKVLKSTVKVPVPKPRPKNYEQRIAKTKLYSFDPATLTGGEPHDKLRPMPVRANIVVAVLGLAMLAINVFLKIGILWVAAFLVCAIGAVILFIQLIQPPQRSAVLYNRGARNFNKENYKKADKMFKRALKLDENNERAEYASNKVSYYL